MSRETGPSGEKHSWRDQPSSGGRHNREEARSWRKPAGGAEDETIRRAVRGVNWSVLGKRTASAFAALVCAGVFYWVLTLLGCTQTSVIVSVAGNYQNCAIPPNLLAKQDGNALADLHNDPDFVVQPIDEWTAVGEAIAAVSANRVLVVYLSAHGGVDAEGPYMLSADADPDRADKVRLGELLTLLAQRPKDQKKLLLLDLCHIQSDWRIGLLENNVLHTFAAMVRERQDIQNLCVICSCSPGEINWTSRNLGPDARGQTVFGHFVIQALRGAADGATAAAQKDGRITVRELFEYVHRHTNSWVISNRDPAGQHPLLVPDENAWEEDDSEFVVVASTLRSSGTQKEGETADPDGDTLRQQDDLDSQCDKLWRVREELRAGFDSGSAEYPVDPLRWRILTHLLLRAERCLLAGATAQAQGVLAQADTMVPELRQAVASSAFRGLEDRGFVSQNITRHATGAAAELAAAPKAASVGHAQTAEGHLQTVCKSHLPPGTQASEELAVEIRALAERATNGYFGTVAAVRPLLQEADRFRREAEDRMFLNNSTGATQGFAEARRRYDEAEAIRKILRKAVGLRNRLYAGLPELARWAALRTPASQTDHRSSVLHEFRKSLSENDVLPSPRTLERLHPELAVREDTLDGLEVRLLVLFDKTRELERELGRVGTVEEASALSTLDALCADTEKRLKEVDSRIRQQAEQLALQPLRQDEPQQIHWRRMRDILRCPDLSADIRNRLYHKLIQDAGQMHQNWDEARPATTPETGTIEYPDPPSIERSLWSALWAIQALSLGEHDAAVIDKLWDSWWRVWRIEQRQQGSELTKLGRAIQTEFLAKRGELHRQFDGNGDTPSSAGLAGGARERLERADQIARTLHPCDGRQILDSLNPTDRLRRYRMAELLAVNAQRYLDDFWKDWYDVAVEDCLAALRQLAVPEFQSEIQALEDRLQARRAAFLEIPQVKLTFGRRSEARTTLTVRRQGDLPEGIAALWINTQRGISTDATRSEIPTSAPTNSFEYLFSKEAFQKSGESECPLRETIAQQPVVFFRGHQWSDRIQPVQVDPCPPSGTHVTYRPMNQNYGEVLVSGDDRRCVMFVLDCSYSMNNVLPNGQSRFQAAIDTLRKAIDTLRLKDDANNPVRIGLMAYGHRVQKLQGEPIQINPNWKPEPQGAVAQDQMLDYEVLVPVHPASVGQMNKLADALSRLEKAGYWGNTPLLGALTLACQDDAFRRGGGTVVAITDGAYMDAPVVLTDLQQKTANMRQAGNAIELHVVGFDVSQQDKDRLQSLRESAGVRFHNAPSGDELALSLQDATNPRPYRVLTPAGDAIEKSLGEVCDRLEPGSYRVEFGQLPPVEEFRILGGERLVFELGGGELRHVPEPMKTESQPNSRGYRLGSQHFHIDRQKDVAELTLSLLDSDLRNIVPRPAQIVLDVRPTGAVLGERRDIVWQPVPKQSVPTWQLTVSNWPAHREGVEIQAYWTSGRIAPDRTFSFTQSRRAQEFVVPGPEATPLSLVLDPVVQRRAEGQIEITLRSPDRTATTPRTPAFYEHLARLRVDILAKDSQASAHWPYTAEFFESEEELVYTFHVPDDIDPSGSTLCITSWQTFLANANKLPQPWHINRPDDRR